MAQLPPAGSGPLIWPARIGHAPEMALVVSSAKGPLGTLPPRFAGVERLLVSMRIFVALLELTATLPNATWEGTSVVAAIPAPLSGIVSIFGPTPASSITVRLLATTDPSAVGVSVIEIVQLPPAATGVPTAQGVAPTLTNA